MCNSEFVGTSIEFWSPIIKIDDLPPCWRDRATQLKVKIYRGGDLIDVKWFVPFHNSPPQYCMLWYKYQKEIEITNTINKSTPNRRSYGS